jgi:hypothetical protein
VKKSKKRVRGGKSEDKDLSGLACMAKSDVNSN